MAKKKIKKQIKKITTIDDLWEPLVVCNDDILEAFNYATVSLPWTFDRMRYGPRTQKAVNNRLIHIFLGVLNQTMLERILTDKGYDCSKEWKNYRDSDIFDFIIGEKKYDVKTMVLYKQYNQDWDREEFSKAFLIQNKDYSGPLWRKFFPIMVTISQLTIDKMKDGYIFGIAESHEDLRKREPEKADEGFWCAVPFKKAFYFFQSTKNIQKREEQRQGFKVKIEWNHIQTTLNQQNRKSNIILHGEWAGEKLSETIDIQVGGSVVSTNNFSSVCCFQFIDLWMLRDDKLIITVENNFTEFVPKTTDPSINLNNDDFEWILTKSSFVNLKVPEDYQIYWIGHIPFEEYASIFPNYPSYFIPHGSNMNENQEGRIHTNLRDKFRAMDNRRQRAITNGKNIPWPQFSSFIKGSNIKAGLLIVAMRGPRPIGAACYYYPPYAMQETALYILPRDLFTMDSL